MDTSKKVTWIQPLSYFAIAKWIDQPQKCVDTGGTNYPHWYFQQEYTTDQIAAANRYWDARFGASDSPAKTTRLSDASVFYNCYRYALESIGKGTWGSVLDQTPPPGGGTAAIPSALNAMCNQVAPSPAQKGDILDYLNDSGQFHASVVAAVDGKGVVTELKWRAIGSGAYDYKTPAGVRPLDTPMYIGSYTDPTQWQWSPSGAGNSDNLYQGKIYRPK